MPSRRVRFVSEHAGHHFLVREYDRTDRAECWVVRGPGFYELKFRSKIRDGLRKENETVRLVRSVVGVPWEFTGIRFRLAFRVRIESSLFFSPNVRLKRKKKRPLKRPR